jgi:hypothetical protein
LNNLVWLYRVYRQVFLLYHAVLHQVGLLLLLLFNFLHLCDNFLSELDYYSNTNKQSCFFSLRDRLKVLSSTPICFRKMGSLLPLVTKPLVCLMLHDSTLEFFFLCMCVLLCPTTRNVVCLCVVMESDCHRHLVFVKFSCNCIMYHR